MSGMEIKIVKQSKFTISQKAVAKEETGENILINFQWHWMRKPCHNYRLNYIIIESSDK